MERLCMGLEDTWFPSVQARTDAQTHGRGTHSLLWPPDDSTATESAGPLHWPCPLKLSSTTLFCAWHFAFQLSRDRSLRHTVPEVVDGTSQRCGSRDAQDKQVSREEQSVGKPLKRVQRQEAKRFFTQIQISIKISREQKESQSQV